MTSADIYQEDLAKIHIDGYAFHWEGAANAVLRFLRENAVEKGTVIDLGCGGGQWLERLSREGYTVCGVDQSESMIKAAKNRVPQAKLILGSFAKVALPDCDAVTSLGEPINYLDGQQSMRRVLRKVFQALRPGGVFILMRVNLPPDLSSREFTVELAKTGHASHESRKTARRIWSFATSRRFSK